MAVSLRLEPWVEPSSIIRSKEDSFMRYLDVCLVGLGMLLVFGLLAVWKFSVGEVGDGGAAVIFAVGGSMFLWAGLLAAFLDWREERGGGSGWKGGCAG